MLFTTGNSEEKTTIKVKWNDYSQLYCLKYKIQREKKRKSKDFFDWHNLGGSSVGSVIPWLGFGGLFLGSIYLISFHKTVILDIWNVNCSLF